MIAILRFLHHTTMKALSYLFLPLSAILYLCNVRFLLLEHYYAIGHLAMEVDCYLKEIALGKRKKKRALLIAPTKKLFGLYPQKVAANAHLLTYIARYITPITSPLKALLLLPFAKTPFLQIDLRHYMDFHKSAPFYSIFAQCEKIFFHHTLEDTLFGKTILQKLGIPQDAWYIALHVRDNAYEKGYTQKCRNSDPKNLKLAIEEIQKRGGYVIRMGAKNSAPLPGTIDYANSPFASPRMDIFLAATCRFFLGSPSGLAFLPCAFGVPLLLHNLVPIAHFPYTKRDLGLPKLYVQNGKTLTIEEALALPASNYVEDERFLKENITLLENSPEQIRDAVIEMFEEKKETPAQTAIKLCLTPQNCGYRAAGNLCDSFLQSQMIPLIISPT